MESELKNFSQQLSWQPEIINVGNLAKADKFIVAGMGGSSLSAGLLKAADPTLDLLLHRDYGLPRVPDYFLRDSLIILSSYSGNTEEVLDTAKLALERGLKLAVVTAGGELLKLAQERQLPYVILPAVSQPRLAVGYTLRAILALQGNETHLAALSQAALNTEAQVDGEALAAKIGARIPVICSSTANYPLAYQWKITLNETAKTAAFANAFPELNHNEMQGYAGGGAYSFIFLYASSDDRRIAKRMSVLQELYQGLGNPVEIINLRGANHWEQIWHSVLLANWTCLSLAQARGQDPVAVPLIEEFKTKLK
jgi:glucose/mannose-6-phosphate isomerase